MKTHLVSFGGRLLKAVRLLSYLVVAVAAPGILEIDLIFPRNETYAPMKLFPIMFAVKNAALAKQLSIGINLFIRNGTAFDSSHTMFTNILRLEVEGCYNLFATPTWVSCNSSSGPAQPMVNSTNFNHFFTIKKGAPELDLVAATSDETACSTQAAPQPRVDSIVTDQSRDYPADEGPAFPDKYLAGTCAVLDTSSPTPTAEPYRVKMDSAATASISAVVRDLLCRGLKPPADCPKPNDAARPLAVVLAAGLGVVVGAAGFLLL
ncbi:hypothetical protein B0T14DRAFT_536659 [Immersiella caudata]|uniref:DUF7136 domain-containing protein n=1 Tax=Immersiella caudata TaxID=314043 RepID=A0AA40C411_9PEZI|nr:hypothetical protein B0T14DRAFT_536659 [Immersiella caudata]